VALDDPSALLGQPPLLLAQLVAGVGALARQQTLELEHPLADFRLDEGGKVLASGLAEPLEVARASKPSCEGHQAELGDGGRSQSACRQKQRIVVGEAMERVCRQGAGGREGGKGKHDRQQDEVALAGTAEGESTEGQGHSRQAGGECELEGEFHRLILRPKEPGLRISRASRDA
jgi:hypothetical protein